MTGLRTSLQDYLALRRSLGYKLESAGQLLASFVSFAEREGASTITTNVALRWATQPAERSSIWLAHRLSVVRGFACHLHALDPTTEIPPVDLLLAPGYQPARPYVYSDADIADLLAAARRLTPPLWAATFETLLGLLAATGMRIGEAMRLNRDDIDWEEGVLTVRSSSSAAHGSWCATTPPWTRCGPTAPSVINSAPLRLRRASSCPSGAEDSSTTASMPPSTTC